MKSIVDNLIAVSSMTKSELAQSWLSYSTNKGKESFRQVPRQHQIEGVEWILNKYGCTEGVIVADEMGLGKTYARVGQP